MEKKRKISGKLWVIILVLVLLVTAVLALSGFITDLLWFREVGYVSVFLTEIMTKLKLGTPTVLIGAAIVFGVLTMLKGSYLKKNSLSIQGVAVKRLRVVTILLAAVYGILLSLTVIPQLWFQILQFANAKSFGTGDPIFGNDIGFYMFRLDFLQGLSGSLVFLLVSLMVVIAVYYALLVAFAGGSKEEEAGDGTIHYEFPDSDKQGPQEKILSTLEKLSNGASPDFSGIRQKGKALLSVALGELTVLGVLFFFVIAWTCYLKRFNLLYSGTGAAYGAGYTDIKITLTAYNIMMVLAVLSAAGLVVAAKFKKYKLAVICPALMIVTAIISAPVAGLVQSVIVAPDELSKESRYLGYNIKYTQQAYDLENIKIKDFTPDTGLDKKDVLNNMETFSNIRINDFDPSEQFYNQTQSIRSYYQFNDVDVDRYYVNGEYTQTFLSARELDESRIEDSWLIKHIKYTHGYGVTLSRVDKVTSSGQPDMLIKSIPPVSDVAEISITRPEIYYGESTDSYVIVKTDEPEFDYPSGESNVYCSYEGEGGIPLSFFNRVLFALREGSLKMLVSNNIDANSRIMINRNIAKRAEKIAPFLSYDDDPYIVAVDGHLYWMLNAYTYSSNYPYSEPYERGSSINYIRNSVKVIIDAYDGTTDFYIVDEDDPVVQTLAGIYPKLFKSYDEMPEGFRTHIQYPNALFNIQAKVYEKYHMSDVDVFYQNEDLWQVSNEIYGQSEMRMTANYFIMKLPGEEDTEFVSALSYSPTGKSNMTAIFFARNDGSNYGELVLYKLPKDRIIYGPAQIEAQINQDTDISKEFSLWNNSGSSYSRGNMYVIPVEDSLLYVEPIYLESSTSSLPEVKRVVMFYGDRLAYKPTLAECLDDIFGSGAGAPLNTVNPIESGKLAAEELDNPKPVEPVEEPVETPPREPIDTTGVPDDATVRELAVLADAAYNNALEAMQQGNWADYGKYMDELAGLISRMAGHDDAAGLPEGDETDYETEGQD
ncbi:MAG: UPF0182 family protein [Firmicutes bacterium]|nr:UPF0182 family protein [Bacillota bacterium]MBR6351463.1 UPF0182 family protein [Bacillota bacterium]